MHHTVTANFLLREHKYVSEVLSFYSEDEPGGQADDSFILFRRDTTCGVPKRNHETLRQAFGKRDQATSRKLNELNSTTPLQIASGLGAHGKAGNVPNASSPPHVLVRERMLESQNDSRLGSWQPMTKFLKLWSLSRATPRSFSVKDQRRRPPGAPSLPRRWSMPHLPPFVQRTA